METWERSEPTTLVPFKKCCLAHGSAGLPQGTTEQPEGRCALGVQAGTAPWQLVHSQLLAAAQVGHAVSVPQLRAAAGLVSRARRASVAAMCRRLNGWFLLVQSAQTQTHHLAFWGVGILTVYMGVCVQSDLAPEA